MNDATDRADAAQHGLTRHFGGPLPGTLRSHSSLRLRDLATFDYWWLAHAIEARVDAYERSGCPGWLALAEQTYSGLRRRNRGSLFNAYFDDMSWLALAALRLFDATHRKRYLDDAQSLFEHIVERGFSTLFGPSIAWRTQQLDYKNAPTNGAFALVSARLSERTGGAAPRAFALSSLAFLDDQLLDRSSGLITDGINRHGDGRRDDDWLFSYNQGLSIGAQLEAFAFDHDAGRLDAAVRTGIAAIDRLTTDGVFASENVDQSKRGGGDIGLFKGVFYRHLESLVTSPLVRSRGDLRVERERLEAFLVSSTDRLWSTFEPSGLASDDWREFATRGTALSTQLSAVLALEARARFEAPTRPEARARPEAWAPPEAATS